MAGKPTYQELEQRIKVLEKETIERERTDESFREGEQKIRALVEAASDWINEFDVKGVYTYVNPKVKDVLGYSPEEVVGRSIFDFMSEKEAERSKKLFEHIIGEHRSFSELVVPHIHKDGRQISLEINGAPFFDSSGNLIGYWGLGRDITERIRAEEELRKSEDRWRSLVENAPNVILILNREGTIKFINKAESDYAGEKAIGRNHNEYVAEEDQAMVKEAIEQVFRSGEPGTYTLRKTGLNGKVGWYETQIGPLKNRKDVVAVILITTDITERKEAEESMLLAHEETERQVRKRTAELLQTNIALQTEIVERKRVEESLQESEQKFRSLVEAMSDMVWELDLNGKYTYVSPKSKDLFGYNPDEMIGRAPWDFMSGENAERAFEHYKGVCEKITPVFEVEGVIVRNDGRRVNTEVSGAAIFGTDGKFIGYRGIDKDITERVRSREEMFQAAKMVSLGTLVSGVAHEINNPITSIMLNSPIVQKIWDDISPALDKYCEENGDITVSNASYNQLRKRVPVLLSDITEGAKRVKRIVDELKNFSRQRPSDLSDDVDINKVVKTTVGLVSNLIKKSTNRFDTEYAVGIPIFKGNIQLIEQVIINLLINACEALPDNERSISISTAYDGHSDRVILKVSDQGEGVLPEVLERIGDPFFTTKRDIGGTGLGLAISTKIIEDHHGIIDFDSTPGQGTVVTVMIPANQRVGGPPVV